MGLGEIVVAVKMPSTRIKTKRPQNLYCNLPLEFGSICVAYVGGVEALALAGAEPQSEIPRLLH